MRNQEETPKMKKNKARVERAAAKLAKAEEKLAKAEERLRQAAEKVEAKKSKLEEARNAHQAALIQQEADAAVAADADSAPTGIESADQDTTRE
jgi:hypothetical protein